MDWPPWPGYWCGRRAAAGYGVADGLLLGALEHAYWILGFDQDSGGDEVFRSLVLARIIEPVSKAGSPRVLEEAGLAGPSYNTPASAGGAERDAAAVW